jgi:diguanylate cyclase (GGDEF)-like protein
MGGVLWLGGGALAALMLTFAPPTRAIGVLGWLVAAGIVALAVVIGVLRLRRPPPSDFGTLFAGSVIALLGIALLEWLAGGRVSPYHQLYALPVVYAAAVHPRRRALLVLALVCLVVWAPVIYAPPDARLPADTAGQLLLLLVPPSPRASSSRWCGPSARDCATHASAPTTSRAGTRSPASGTGSASRRRSRSRWRARRQGTSLSLIIGDLDGFKEINDAFGHAGGDECLRRVARAIGEASRTEDQCYRWGGDEFAVVLPDTTEDHAAEVRRRICAATSAVCLSPDGGEVRMTCGTAELGADDTGGDAARRGRRRAAPVQEPCQRRGRRRARLTGGKRAD